MTGQTKMTPEQWKRYLAKMRRLGEILERRCANNPPPWAKRYDELMRQWKNKGDGSDKTIA
jgi:hypothetical protein